MDFLFNISPFIKLLAIFILIIVFIKQRLSLGTALTAGSILLGLWFNLPLLQIGVSVFRSLVADRTVTLCVVVALILVLSHSMEKTGQMKRLLASFKGISQNLRLNLALFPALIGLLPMPGGAIFSAPIVNEIGTQESLLAEQKTLINYWFRHIWEFCWPLYPGVILTCALSGIDMWTFVIVQFPLTLFTAGVGYLMYLRSIPTSKQGPTGYHKQSLKRFFTELMPILLVVGGSVFFGAMIYLASKAWPLLGSLPKESSLIMALVVSISWVWWQNKVSLADVRRILLNRSLLSMIYMVAGIMVFQGILKDSQAISEISHSLTSAHVPIVLVIMMLPFLVGSITGITVAFVGTTFPIIFSLLSGANISQILPYTILAFCSGYVGVLFSPLHICLVITCDYFRVDLPRIYRKLWPPCAAVATAGVLSFWINQVM